MLWKWYTASKLIHSRLMVEFNLWEVQLEKQLYSHTPSFHLSDWQHQTSFALKGVVQTRSDFKQCLEKRRRRSITRIASFASAKFLQKYQTVKASPEIIAAYLIRRSFSQTWTGNEWICSSGHIPCIMLISYKRIGINPHSSLLRILIISSFI